MKKSNTVSAVWMGLLLAGMFPAFAAPDQSLFTDIPMIDLQKDAPQQEKTFPYNSNVLRNPFWDVGWFPDGWGGGATRVEVESEAGWAASSKKIAVTGTSRMGNRTVAIINGDIKGPGDLIQVVHGGRVYQWKLVKIHSNGEIQLDRYTVR